MPPQLPTLQTGLNVWIRRGIRCGIRVSALSLALAAVSAAETVAAAKARPVPVPLVVQPAGSRAKTQPPTASKAELPGLGARQPEWRLYGPLRVDWSSWTSMGGSVVAPTINSKGQTIHLSVNCSVGKINVAGANGVWRGWQAPQVDFERQLVKDACAARRS
ncbi:hypothetical protein VB716_04460 [Synechococcus sp. CCY9201]|jgi:hypothetical protein|uniref:hypothetical protein n=1 Tax=unclassified Synechococcus TaxID=2626047 RepID=UPI0018CC994C|nr:MULTISPECIES: hypothetical protein [unclassified Synechococcus]MEA5473469.1 hypothetical protein [Synechococcus sp. CCY9201]QPN61111.1 hypothetical protein H8F24_07500 [Synechococcus sp. CBW1002]QPN67234.1 hypothetical protein H8F26_03045 [Synechococcus sp. CBW1006]